MSQIKFRALIGNDLMFWDLQDMCGPHRFSMRAIICPWLLEGNVPDQFTGLHDKNGAEIYEGDIIEFSSEMVSGERDVVAYRAGFYRNFTMFEQAEVIGNIHQHPGLLPEATS